MQQDNPYSQQNISGVERVKSERSLIALLRGCVGYKTLLELRNETTVYGRILNCDGYMNLIVENAALTRLDGTRQEFAQLHVLGKNVRYVHIPDELDIRTTITRQLATLRKSREGAPVMKHKGWHSKNDKK